jgi:histidyl-tRNA synthetase
MRIFDSKEETDQRVARDAPAFVDYQNAESRRFFDRVRAGLDRLGIVYRLNPRLVRGLDYYTHTAFEYMTADLGAQGTVMGGGRYDGLVEMMGGPALPGVGLAAGIERLAMLIAEPSPPPRPIAVVPIGEAAEGEALTLAEMLRNHDWAVDLGYSGNVARRMRRANNVNARVALLIGEEEVARNVVALRDLDSGEQTEVPMDPSFSELRARLQAFYG